LVFLRWLVGTLLKDGEKLKEAIGFEKQKPILAYKASILIENRNPN